MIGVVPSAEIASEAIVQLSVDGEGGFLRIRLLGHQDGDSLLDALSRAQEHPAWRTDVGRLWDLTEATMVGLSKADVDRIVAATGTTDRNAPGARVAVVVTRDVDYGLMRMIDALTENASPDDMRIFRDRDEAEQWLRRRA